jgi:7-cyano-7-deazaguanine reductase
MALTEVMKKQKEQQEIVCIVNNSKLPLNITLNAIEFSWNCPSVQQPDFGKVIISYIPDKRIVETKSLKFYLQRYRYLNAYNEELAHRICLDFVYYVNPIQATVRLEQNNRGGIFNTAEVFYNAEVHSGVVTDYTPKRGFQGGWGWAPSVNGKEKPKHAK